jgi:hypothetical protein
MSTEVPCDVEGNVSFAGATIGGTLSFNGTSVRNGANLAVDGAGATISGTLQLATDDRTSRPFVAEGGVSLFGASIGRDLDCKGGQFTNPGGDALTAANAKIDGGVALVAFDADVLFVATGAVSLFGASIGHNLDCRSAYSHLKVVIVDGIYTVRGSTNWSLSGETKQDNELTLSRNAVIAAETRWILDLNHDYMLKQMAKARGDTPKT